MVGRTSTWVPWMLVATLVTAACSDDQRASGQPPDATVDTTTAPPPDPADSTLPADVYARGADDGVLTIGVLLPRSDQIGQSGINAVDTAVSRINEEAGVFGEPVAVVVADEGPDADTARQGIDLLVDAGVDAIVGPASSLVTLEVLDELMTRGIVTCSPTAGALALNDYPNRDLFFRTIPSDSLIAYGLATQAQNTGFRTAQVIYLDDAYGRPLSRQIVDEAPPGLDFVNEIAFPPGETAFSDEIAQLAEYPDSTIIVVADAANGWALIAAMSELFNVDPPAILVTDPMKVPPDRELVAGLPTELRRTITGLSPVGLANRQGIVGPFAMNSFDCVNLIALAAIEAGTDHPDSVARAIPPTSTAGQPCTNFRQCLALVNEGLDINYQGSAMDISPRGDVVRAPIEFFRFDEAGRDYSLGGGVLTVTDPTT